MVPEALAHEAFARYAVHLGLHSLAIDYSTGNLFGMERTMSDTTLDKVRDFHTAFDLPIGEEPSFGDLATMTRRDLWDFALKAEQLSSEMWEAAGDEHGSGSCVLLRLALCMEEFSELIRAVASEDMVETLDALCDMRYVADGFTTTLGLSEEFPDAFQEVHLSNLSKLGTLGHPIFDEFGKVKKGPQYFKPDIAGVLDEHKEERDDDKD